MISRRQNGLQCRHPNRRPISLSQLSLDILSVLAYFYAMKKTVNIAQLLHHRLKVLAALQGLSLEQYVSNVLTCEVSRADQQRMKRDAAKRRTQEKAK